MVVRMKSEPPVLTAEEIKELEAAELLPAQDDADCPQMTPEMLSQFQRVEETCFYFADNGKRKKKENI